MKLVSCFVFGVALTTCAPVFASIESQMPVLEAKQNLAEALIKVSLLTNSFSEQAKQNPELAGQEEANEITNTFDQTIAQSISKGETCEIIIARAEDNSRQGMIQSQKDSGGSTPPVVLKAIKNFFTAATQYQAAQCKYMTE